MSIPHITASQEKMKTMDERKIDPTEEMTRAARNFLDLLRWGFRESYSSAQSGNLIYDSEWCRVNLVWGGWDYGSGNSISIYYGRSHAPNEEITMIYNGEARRCWHDIDYGLHFLDGRTPTEAILLNQSHPITDPFYEEEFRHKFDRRQPEWITQMHTAIWRNYGKSCFELFDLRRMDLWDKYCQFLKEIYDLKGRRPYIKPPLDKIC